VSLQGNHARVSFSLDSSQHLTTTSTATIHFENLLGQRFLAILPGAAGGQPLRQGGTIPLSQTTPALDLTAVFDGFEPLFSALAPDQVNQLSQSIIAVFQGESGTVSSLVAETAAITSNLADRQAVINGLLTSLASLLNAVGVHDTQLGQLISNFDTLVQGLATSRSQLGSAITNLSTLTTTVSGLLAQSQPQLDQDVDGLATASQSLAANQAGINSLLEGFPGLVNALTKVQSTGNWINAYICDLTVNVEGGPLNISIIPGIRPPVYPENVTLPSGAVGNQSVHTASCS
jgi:phospholipid/cholesterol/gamma-HCH transport system substrate-binding protein